MLYHSIKDIINIAQEENKEFWEIILENDCNERKVSKEESMAEMQKMYDAMVLADKTYNPNKKSHSKVAGGNGALLSDFVQSGKNLSGEFIGKAMSKAISMAETNACMGRIVAAPTAGSCGVLPAVIITYEEMFNASGTTESNPSSNIQESESPSKNNGKFPSSVNSEDAPTNKSDTNMSAIKALFTAGGIGEIISEKASLAGADRGCQAEIGSAAAMAAGALTALRGGSIDQITDAAAIALKSLLGLTCDPVDGLVEVPCIKRNAIAASISVAASDMAMAGIQSMIPLDDVIDAMNEIGLNMPEKYRETSLGGLAVTEAAEKLCHGDGSL